MKAAVLMAGKGTRMAKYYEGPKQLLPVKGKPVVEHMLDQLPEDVKELIFVVGGPHEMTIRDHFNSGEYGGCPITFVVQKEQLGLAHAFWTAQEEIGGGRWIGVVGDDIFGPEGLREMVNNELAILGARVDNPESFGVLVVDDDGYLVRSVEKPKEFVSDIVSTGAFVMDEEFFDVKIEPSDRGEFETPDVFMKLVEERRRKIKVAESELWLPVNNKEQLEEAERALESRI